MNTLIEMMKDEKSEGKIKEEKLVQVKESVCFVKKYLNIIGCILPVFTIHMIWWYYMISTKSFDLFSEKAGCNHIPRFYMTIFMAFGSIIAGATSEGGGAISFPVMTLLFSIDPDLARDFAFMIQSVGMTTAACVILWMRFPVEWRALMYCTIGGTAGIILGLEYIHLEAAYSKMYFVVIWGAFAICLYYLNSIHNRKVYLVLDPPEYPNIWKDGVIFEYGKYVTINWKACVLIATGFLGGLFSSLSGSGLDICTFAILTLLFRVSEQTSTPTSVVLMAINGLVGFAYREFGQDGVDKNAWGYFLVCVPVVCIGAPMGSIIGSYLHRFYLALAIVIIVIVQLIAALYIVQPWVETEDSGHNSALHLSFSSLSIFVGGLAFFFNLEKIGRKLLDRNEEIEKESSSQCSIDDSSQSTMNMSISRTFDDVNNNNEEYKYDDCSHASHDVFPSSTTSSSSFHHTPVSSSSISSLTFSSISSKSPSLDLTTSFSNHHHHHHHHHMLTSKEIKHKSKEELLLDQVHFKNSRSRESFNISLSNQGRVYDDSQLFEHNNQTNDDFLEFLKNNQNQNQNFDDIMMSNSPRRTGNEVFMSQPPDWMGQGIMSDNDSIQKSSIKKNTEIPSIQPPDWMGQGIRDDTSLVEEDIPVSDPKVPGWSIVDSMHMNSIKEEISFRKY